MIEESLEGLEQLEEMQDNLDDQILELIDERNGIDAIIRNMWQNLDMPAWNQKRTDEVIDKYIEQLGSREDGIKIATAIIGTEEQLMEIDE